MSVLEFSESVLYRTVVAVGQADVVRQLYNYGDGNGRKNWSRRACVRSEAKLAIVFTYFFPLLLFSTPSAFHPLRGISRV